MAEAHGFRVRAGAGGQATAALGLWLAVGAAVSAAGLPNPRLLVLWPPGGRQGTELEVSVEGDDLDEAAALVFTHPGITATPKLAPRRFEKQPEPFATRSIVKISPDVPPGFYEARVQGRFGLSNPRPFEVSDLEQVAEPADNHTPEKALPLPLDTIVDCRADSSNVDYFQFTAAAGQRVIVLCRGRGLDSRLSPLLEVLDASGAQLGFGRGTFRREPVIDFTAPAEGTYRVRVADATYRGSSQFPYRLVLSTRPFIDSIWPPVATVGTKGSFTVFGRNLPGGTAVPDGEAGLERLDVEIEVPAALRHLGVSGASTRRDPYEIEVQGFDYRLPAPQGPSNPAFIAVTDLPIVVEDEPANDDRARPQPLTPPCEVTGRFHPSRDADWFSFAGTKGESYTVEVFSERLTLPTDPAVRVEFVGSDDKGQEVVRTVAEQDDPPERFTNNRPFDAPTHDPAVQFTADADGTYRVVVRDLYAGSLARPSNVYRLVVRTAAPDFQLLATCKQLVQYTDLQSPAFPAGPNLRRGGTQSLVVQAYRRGGFSGPIALAVEGLPPGVTCPTVSIPAGEHQAGIVLAAAADAPAWQGPITVVGTARLGDRDVRREAPFSTTVWNKNNRAESIESRVSTGAMLAVIAEEAPFRLVPTEGNLREVAQGGKLDIRFEVPRRHALTGSLRVELRGFPAAMFKQLPSVVVDAQVTEGTLTLTLPAQANPGEYPLFLVGQVRVNYPRNPEAAARAEARKQEFAAEVSRLTEESKTAEAARAEAEKKAMELAAVAGDSSQTAVVAAATEAKNKAAEAAKAAAETLQAAIEEQKHLEKQVTDLAAAAAPRETDSFIASESFVVRVLAAAAAAAAKPAQP